MRKYRSDCEKQLKYIERESSLRKGIGCFSDAQLIQFSVTLQVYTYPGGEIQWARFRNDVNEYLSDEEMAFGKSINNHRSKMTFGTLRIKSKGLRAPHWHFNANEHGYLLQVLSH